MEGSLACCREVLSVLSDERVQPRGRTIAQDRGGCFKRWKGVWHVRPRCTPSSRRSPPFGLLEIGVKKALQGPNLCRHCRQAEHDSGITWCSPWALAFSLSALAPISPRSPDDSLLEGIHPLPFLQVVACTPDPPAETRRSPEQQGMCV